MPIQLIDYIWHLASYIPQLALLAHSYYCMKDLASYYLFQGLSDVSGTKTPSDQPGLPTSPDLQEADIFAGAAALLA